MKKIGILGFSLLTATLTACDTTQWPGPGSDTTQEPKIGGYPEQSGATFGGWVNNAWGEKSTIIPTYKDHPPLAGVNVCLLDQNNAECAITDSEGRFDLVGLPNGVKDEYHISIQLKGYYSLLIPYYPYSHNYTSHPALEIPSLILEQQTYQQVLTQKKPNTGGMNFFIVEGTLEPDPNAADHEEINKTIEGVGVIYRKVTQNADGSESYGPWSNPNGWTLGGGDVMYLNTSESPDMLARTTSKSGLGIAINLDPGLYEVRVDDPNTVDGLDYLTNNFHYDCKAVDGSPARKEGQYTYARARVVVNHLTDVRFDCQTVAQP